MSFKSDFIVIIFKNIQFEQKKRQFRHNFTQMDFYVLYYNHKVRNGRRSEK